MCTPTVCPRSSDPFLYRNLLWTHSISELPSNNISVRLSQIFLDVYIKEIHKILYTKEFNFNVKNSPTNI